MTRKKTRRNQGFFPELLRKENMEQLMKLELEIESRMKQFKNCSEVVKAQEISARLLFLLSSFEKAIEVKSSCPGSFVFLTLSFSFALILRAMSKPLLVMNSSCNLSRSTNACFMSQFVWFPFLITHQVTVSFLSLQFEECISRSKTVSCRKFAKTSCRRANTTAADTQV